MGPVRACAAVLGGGGRAVLPECMGTGTLAYGVWFDEGQQLRSQCAEDAPRVWGSCGRRQRLQHAGGQRLQRLPREQGLQGVDAHVLESKLEHVLKIYSWGGRRRLRRNTTKIATKHGRQLLAAQAFRKTLRNCQAITRTKRSNFVAPVIGPTSRTDFDRLQSHFVNSGAVTSKSCQGGPNCCRCWPTSWYSWPTVG